MVTNSRVIEQNWKVCNGNNDNSNDDTKNRKIQFKNPSPDQFDEEFTLNETLLFTK